MFKNIWHREKQSQVRELVAEAEQRAAELDAIQQA